jgi:hypothetical protein
VLSVACLSVFFVCFCVFRGHLSVFIRGSLLPQAKPSQKKGPGEPGPL